MFLVSNDFIDTTHGSLGCITCHDGQNVPDKELAHEGMNPYPSVDANGSCGDCHKNVTDTFATSIHANIQGMTNGLLKFTEYTALEDSSPHGEAFDKNCLKCHATCGDCHVSRPKAYSQGLIDNHTFFKTPPMEETCYGCHNARNAGEFMGKVGFSGDVHYEKGMTCMDCHPKGNFHGTGDITANMWEEDLPSCVDCHEDKSPDKATDNFHKVHGDSLSCQVCHAQANNNCFECHLDYNEDKTKLVGSSEIKVMFRIGLNPSITEKRPYKYVVLRHIPTAENTLDTLGDNLLPNFDEISNWKYSPSHNIQKSTFQNESCEACHNNTKIWLSPKDLRESDSKANEALIPDLPPPLD